MRSAQAGLLLVALSLVGEGDTVYLNGDGFVKRNGKLLPEK